MPIDITLRKTIRHGVGLEGPLAMLKLLLACASAALIISAAHADEPAASTPEGVYICLQNSAMTGSVWHPVECKRLAAVEDQIADRSGKSVVQVDSIEPPNAVGSISIWWKVDFRGVGRATDKTAHWFCSDHGGGFACVWQNTHNVEDWQAYSQFRDFGMTEIPSVFWVPKQLANVYEAEKPLLERRAVNEARYAKAEALAKSSAFQWSYIPPEGGACRPLGTTTPFKFMQSVSAKRHHSPVDWDAASGDEDASHSVVATSNDRTLPLKDLPVQEYQFFVSTEACNATLAQTLPHEGVQVSDADLEHKPAVRWLITDATEADKIACHWPSAATGKSPKEFLAVLKQKGADVTEVSKNEVSTTDNRTSFEISFAYTLKGRANEVSWSDLGDFGCDPQAKDRLQLP